MLINAWLQIIIFVEVLDDIGKGLNPRFDIIEIARL